MDVIKINRESLAVLDGNSLLYRAFYAIPELTTKEGVYTNGVYGFLNMLLKIKEDINPDYIVAAFDKSSNTFRHKEYEDYKAGRKKTPPELSMQFPIIREILSKMGISVFELEGYEADDLIGTISVLAEEEGMEVYVVTGDKDALQLATDNVNVVINKKGITEKEIYNKERFIEDFGLTPTQYIDVKGLMGDKSDNIPGVPGIGEKTAFKLIKEYGSIEDVLMNISNISGKKLKESLQEYSEQAIFSKKLATIITKVPVEIPMEQLRTKGNFNNSEVRDMCLRLQFKSLLNKFENLSQDSSETPENQRLEVVDYKIINEIKDLNDVIPNIKNRVFVKLYVEDTSNFAKIMVKTIGILSEGQVYLLYCDKLLEEDREGFIKAMKIIFHNSSLEKITHGIKYGYTAFLKLGIDLDLVNFDVEIAAYLLDSSKSEYSIKTLYEERLGKTFDGDEDSLKANEIVALEKIYTILKEEIEKEDMEELLFKVEQPLTKVISYMEYEGFNINRKELENLGTKFSGEIDTLTKEVYHLAGEEFNINSPKQLGKILFEKLDLPVIKKTKTGYSTNAEVLDALKDKHEIINKILYFRQITKLYSTYIEGLKNVIDEDIPTLLKL